MTDKKIIKNTYIVAEISANHCQSLKKAIKLIEIAKDCGADAVKIQSYEAKSLTIDCQTSDFQVTEGLWHGETLFSLYEKACTPFDWHKKIFQFAKENGITVISKTSSLVSIIFRNS